VLSRDEYDGLEIAAVNTGRSITVSGSHRGLDLFLSHARKKRWPFRKLDVAQPYHSRFADPIQDGLVAALEHLSCRPTRAPFISSVYGRTIDGERLDANYWWNNIRRTVDFKSAVETALDGKPGVLLEIGPSPVLTGYMSDLVKDAGATVTPLASLERNENPTAIRFSRRHREPSSTAPPFRWMRCSAPRCMTEPNCRPIPGRTCSTASNSLPRR
jgi:acyl transferase domain-containing protein